MAWSEVLVIVVFIAEFAAQLPPEGGTFYTHDTVDLSRPYYKISWPPLLQAAALWLGYVNDSAASAEPDNVYSNHFFLVFGNNLPVQTLRLTTSKYQSV